MYESFITDLIDLLPEYKETRRKNAVVNYIQIFFKLQSIQKSQASRSMMIMENDTCKFAQKTESFIFQSIVTGTYVQHGQAKDRFTYNDQFSDQEQIEQYDELQNKVIQHISGLSSLPLLDEIKSFLVQNIMLNQSVNYLQGPIQYEDNDLDCDKTSLIQKLQAENQKLQDLNNFLLQRKLHYKAKAKQQSIETAGIVNKLQQMKKAYEQFKSQYETLQQEKNDCLSNTSQVDFYQNRISLLEQQIVDRDKVISEQKGLCFQITQQLETFKTRHDDKVKELQITQDHLKNIQDLNRQLTLDLRDHTTKAIEKEQQLIQIQREFDINDSDRYNLQQLKADKDKEILKDKVSFKTDENSNQNQISKQSKRANTKKFFQKQIQAMVSNKKAKSVGWSLQQHPTVQQGSQTQSKTDLNDQITKPLDLSNQNLGDKMTQINSELSPPIKQKKSKFDQLVSANEENNKLPQFSLNNNYNLFSTNKGSVTNFIKPFIPQLDLTKPLQFKTIEPESPDDFIKDKNPRNLFSDQKDD